MTEDIVTVIGRYLPLEPAGANFSSHCPFHGPENMPSFYVNPYRQIWHCFGCHRGGTAAQFIKAFEKLQSNE